MTPKEFFDLVHRMRVSQKEYFRTRNQQELRRSKALENEVDREISRVLILMYDKQKEEQHNETDLR